jgi:hypothetical protein
MKRSNRRRLHIPQHEFAFNAESRIMPSGRGDSDGCPRNRP